MERLDSDGGLWMKIDANGVSNYAASSAESPPDEDLAIPAPPAVVSRYYSVMDDEGADDVFIPLPPPPPPPPPPSDSDGVWPPAGGSSTDDWAGNSAVTPPSGAADATEAEANPGGLDGHNGAKLLTAAPEQVDEEGASAVQTSQGSMDHTWPSDDSSTLSNQDQTSMDSSGCPAELRHDALGAPYHENSSGNEESNEDFAISSGRKENSGESGVEIELSAEETPWRRSDSLDDESHFTKGGDKRNSEDICASDETESKVSEENLGVDVSDDDGRESSEELCKRNEIEDDQAQVDEGTADGGEQVDSRSVDYNLTKRDWARRESADAQTHQLPDAKSSAEIASRGDDDDGSKKRASDIQQGEQLLQRLQMLQLRHDVEEKGEFGQETEDLRARERNPTGDEEEEKEEDEEANLMEKEENEKNGRKDVETQAKSSSSGGPEKEEIHMDAEYSDDDRSDSWKPVDLSPDDVDEKAPDVPFLSTGHRFSTAETSMEKQIQEDAQRKQNLQRAGGVFNLADDPDVLEIPFKTDVALEPFPARAGGGGGCDWQFSEQKMQKEISQEIQRELVLVNQGKIPGGYSKGEVRHMKETKLLFEAFQQDNTEGPTRLRKPTPSLSKGPIYPSVLERTRSLEMFSLKTTPVSRALSLRVVESPSGERDKSPESFRARSPTGGLRDKTRLSPYSKQDKHARLHRSMDSISAAEARGKAKEEGVGAAARRSPILQQNPFVKLRPALALQPDVEKDIREAREREEELRRQRSSLYGERKQRSDDDERSRSTQNLKSDVKQLSRGKLERVWPPPSKKEPKKPEQQEPKVQRAAGQRAPLWQRWEAGLINGQPAKEKK